MSAKNWVTILTITGLVLGAFAGEYFYRGARDLQDGDELLKRHDELVAKKNSDEVDWTPADQHELESLREQVGPVLSKHGAADTRKDIWTAAAYGNLEAVRGHVERGVSIDGEEPIFGQSPLAWAVIGDRRNVVDYLLEAGADPSARYRDRNTALHAAAFFGRANAASLLLDAGAEVDARNIRGETPLDAMRHDQVTTEFIAGLLKLPVDFDAVVAGRDRIQEMIETRAAISGLAEHPDGHPLEADTPGRFGPQ